MDATQWAGLLAFGSAALACLVGRGAGLKGIGAINALLAAECALGWRHGLHDAVIAAIGSWYDRRTPFQTALTLAAILAIAVITLLLARAARAHARTAVPAMLATGCAILLFAAETISLHAIDRILYLPAGPLLVIGWAWAGLGLATALAALAARRSSPGA